MTLPNTQSPVSAPTALPMMQPVLRRGRSFLDRTLLPGDENEKRLNDLIASAGEQGLDGVVIFGAAHSPENLIYYANHTPTTFHSVLVAGTDGPPTLFAGKGGARDHPYIRTISWVSDIRYAAMIGDAIVDLADSWSSPWHRLGVVGLDTSLPHHVRDEVVATLGDRIVSVDELTVHQRRQKSAREVAVLTRAKEIASAAAAAAVTAYDSGAGRRSALAAADFAARAGDAHDCRITAGTSFGLATMAEVGDDYGPLSAVIAVEHLGYWGMAPIQLGGQTVDRAALDRIVARLRPEATPSEVLGPENEDAGSFLINGVGCALAEAPSWGEEPDVVLEPHDVLTIVQLLPNRDGVQLDVRTVVIDEDGARHLS